MRIILIWLLAVMPSISMAQPLSVYDLRCENLTAPLGIDNAIPHFSWKNKAGRNGAAQTAYQIEVASDSLMLVKGHADIWRSGHVKSSQSVLVAYDGAPLHSNDLCYWRVRTWDEHKQVSEWSQATRFSIGPLEPSAFAGQWIGLSKEAADITSPILKKNVTIDGTALTFVRVTSLGYHELYVNGHKVGDGILQPAVSQLDKRSLIVTYDVTPYIHNGTNELRLWLGIGWYKGTVTRTEYEGPLVKADMIVHGKQEWKVVAQTDESWTGRPSGYHDLGTWHPLQFGGERIDGDETANDTRWYKTAVVNTEGRVATPQMCEANRVIDRLKPVRMFRQDSLVVFDFGRVITGWFSLEMKGLRHRQKISMTYADWLHDGRFESYGEHDEYIASGIKQEHFINKFNHHAFRFVAVQGWDDVSADDVTALQISGGYKEGSAFECSDSDINTIHDMMARTMRCLAFSGYMVDCPHLERMGYGGDGNSSTLTVQTMEEMAPTYYNWLTAWGDAMEADGDLPYVAPAGGGGGGPYWSSFIIKAPWRTYVNYGDSRMMVALYEKMKSFIRYTQRYVKNGLLHPWPDTKRRMWFLGDWAVPDGVEVSDKSVLLTNNCVLSDCYATMAHIAKALKKNEECKRFCDLADTLNANITKTFFNVADSTYGTGTPLDMSYPLLLGIVPAQWKEAVTQKLLQRSYTTYKGHIAAGLVGTAVVTHWAEQSGHVQLMYDILKKNSFPGYLYMIRQGATTTWEYWNGFRSHVHNCYNGVGSWFYRAFGGICPDERAPGYRHFFVAPQRPTGISWAKARVTTPYGDIETEWHGDKLTVTVPVGTSATISWQGHSYEKKAGRWIFH